jgi:predicted nucleic acid-binding protein
MTRVPAFWDTSALVPLCVRQRATPAAVALYKTHDVVIWWATAVEIASALARLARMKQITPSDYTKARKLAKTLADSWSIVQPSDALRAKAMQLVERHNLRAADALQLAAALGWCEDAPHGQPFLTADDRLREAAEISGFDSKPM